MNQEERLKYDHEKRDHDIRESRARVEQTCGDAGVCGTIGKNSPPPHEVPLRERIRAEAEKSVSQANHETLRAERFGELAYLADKYPEIVRLIELLSITLYT